MFSVTPKAVLIDCYDVVSYATQWKWNDRVTLCRVIVSLVGVWHDLSLSTYLPLPTINVMMRCESLPFDYPNARGQTFCPGELIQVKRE